MISPYMQVRVQVRGLRSTTDSAHCILTKIIRLYHFMLRFFARYARLCSHARRC